MPHAGADLAGECLRLAVKERYQAEDISSVVYALVDGLGIHLLELKTESHVLTYVHVRIQSVRLEHHADVAVNRRNIVHELSADHELAVIPEFGGLCML